MFSSTFHSHLALPRLGSRHLSVVVPPSFVLVTAGLVWFIIEAQSSSGIYSTRLTDLDFAITTLISTRRVNIALTLYRHL